MNSTILTAGKKIIRDISAGCYHNLIVTNDNQLFAWGSNIYDALGIGSDFEQIYPFPVAVNMSQFPIGSSIVQISAGEDYNFVMTSEHSIFHWGTTTTFYTKISIPIKLTTMNQQEEAIITLVEGWRHVLMFTQNGTLYAMGNNQYGQLGDGTTTSSYNDPVRATELQTRLSNVKMNALVAGRYNTYLIVSPFQPSNQQQQQFILKIMLIVGFVLGMLVCVLGLITLVIWIAYHLLVVWNHSSYYKKIKVEEFSDSKYYAAPD